MYKWLLKANLYIDCKNFKYKSNSEFLKLTIVLHWDDGCMGGGLGKKTLKPLNTLMKTQFQDENSYAPMVCP